MKPKILRAIRMRNRVARKSWNFIPDALKDKFKRLLRRDPHRVTLDINCPRFFEMCLLLVDGMGDKYSVFPKCCRPGGPRLLARYFEAKRRKYQGSARFIELWPPEIINSVQWPSCLFECPLPVLRKGPQG